ncbi:MAG: DNA polymerase [Lachnospiraceae bacterium]|nr:DNA polymerase [Lachnospiraceae bacterium]
MGYKKHNYFAEFKTNNSKDDCRVWSWGLHDIETSVDKFSHGNDIDSFMNICCSMNHSTILFHNLKFQGQFIIYWLLHNGYIYNHKPNELLHNSFTALISENNTFYQIKICKNVYIRKDGRQQGNYITFLDSYKKLPFTVENIAKSFNMEVPNEKIDCNIVRKKEYSLTNEELCILKKEVMIVSDALNVQFSQGLDKMTIGADCLSSFKKSYPDGKFRKLFPVIDLAIFSEILEAYRGGWMYVNPAYTNKDVGYGMSFDVNGLYSSVMVDENNAYPVGEPVFFNDKYTHNDSYPLYIQHISAIFTLKDGMLPTLQAKKNPSYEPNKYITMSDDDKPTEMWLSSVDLELFFEHYDIMYIEYLNGYMFAQKYHLFDDYIYYWNGIKEKSDGGQRLLAKLQENNLYGKFASNKKQKNKFPKLNDDDVVVYEIEKYQYKKEDGTIGTRDYKITDGVYIPVGVFVTSYARRVTIKTAQKAYEKGIFAYADTDSIHIITDEVPDYIEIDQRKLGAWKFEGHFDRARFLGPKKYIEEVKITEEEYMKIQNDPKCDNKSDYYEDETGFWCKNLKCSGMSDNIKQDVEWNTFYMGYESEGMLKPMNVKGGCILVDYGFTLKS